MLKDRRHQGLLPYMMSSGVLILVGFLFLLYYLIHFGANQLYSQGKVLNHQTKSGNVAVQVIYIYPNAVSLKDRGTELYLIGYADQKNQIGYIGLEAKKQDRLIKRLYQDNDHLIDNPYRLEAEVLKIDDELTVSNFNQLVNRLKKSTSALGQEMDKQRFVSLSLAKQNRNRFYLLSVAFLGLGIVILVMAYLKKAKNAKALADFYDIYLELDDSLDKAKSYANFIIEGYDILIYNHHLLTYGRDIRLLDLRQLNSIHQIYKTVKTTEAIKQIGLPMIEIQAGTEKKQTIRLKKLVPMNLEPLFVYLNRYFAHIITDDVVSNEETENILTSAEIEASGDNLEEEVIIDLEDLD